MAKIEKFEDLEIWINANEIVLELFAVTNEPAFKAEWGLKDQVRRAAISISNNIAEGFEYNNNKEFIRFLKYPKGSAGELRNQLFVLKESGFIQKEVYFNLYDKLISLSKQIKGFMKYLQEFESTKKQVA